MTKEDWIARLNLKSHIEGGYFSETYRSKEKLTVSVDERQEERSLLTSIFYLLTDKSPIDHFHKNRSDVIHYFQAGSPVIYMIIHPNGEFQKIKLGLDFDSVPQIIVKGGCWKAAQLVNSFQNDYDYCLLGEAVSPGFDYKDMQIADNKLLNEFPHLREKIQGYIKPTQ